MGRLKSAMFDVGYFAIENGITAAQEEFHMSEGDIKACVLFTCAFQGEEGSTQEDEWDQFVQQGNWEEPKLH
tara:strand:+ start:323 stop:538 length:216 start_codon:yes stop_codon:yes gene_type:complete